MAIDVSKPGTFTTLALETHIEALLDECGPSANANASFGMNTERWSELEDSVREYIRLVRNGRGGR